MLITDLYVTIGQAAFEQCVTRQTIYRWTKNGLPVEDFGRAKIIKREDLKKWIYVCPTCGARRLSGENNKK